MQPTVTSDLRLQILSYFPSLRNPHSVFRELDGMFIHTWEIVDAMYPSESEQEREPFRFQLCIGRIVGETAVGTIKSLNLAHCRLSYLDPQFFKDCHALESLDLSHNFLNDKSVEEACLADLRVASLNLEANFVSAVVAAVCPWL